MAEKNLIGEKMLTIIIPHFNSPDLLLKLLETIPQTEDVEIIVIDDNSDDQRSYDQLSENRFSNISFLRNDKGPKGAGTCRNIGIAAATGKWLLFADSDDYYIKDFYAIVNKYFSCDIDVIFFTPTSEDLLTGKISDRHVCYEQLIDNSLNLNSAVSDLDLRYKFSVPWSKMIKRNLIIGNDIKFDEIIASNDIMFSVRVGHAMNEYLVSKEIIYCVTKGKGTLTKIMNESVYFARLDAFINRDKFLKEHLDEAEYNTLSISGGGMVANCMLYKLGIRNTIKAYIRLRRSKVRVWSDLGLGPVRLYNKINWKINHVKQEKKYF